MKTPDAPTNKWKAKYTAWIIVVFVFGAAIIIASNNIANASLNFKTDNNTKQMVEVVANATYSYNTQYLREVNMTYALSLCQKDNDELRLISQPDFYFFEQEGCARAIRGEGKYGYICESKWQVR